MRAPIPNIKKLLSTIGAKNPKLFAKMDLTTGFWQAPMHEDSMKYTAFASDEGLYEFTRASMGLLNSPFHFQLVMETEAFPHLLHRIMEIYIDDLLTWAQDVDQLCENLQQIFDALRKVNMTLNPDKCEFGMSEVEFVGHLIDESGITFTEDKLKQVAQMPLPETKGELKQFLGLGNYFRNHIPDYANLTVHLNGMLEGYEKRTSKQRIEWTPELQQQFLTCQTSIIDCKKLYYVHANAPIRVYTDASDYGIGAYLCQVLEDGEEIPIEFISKTLTKPERKWSTYEKEAFAIFYALRKWETHLRDVQFTLFTDHRNLTFMAKDPNAKVTRWRLAVQDYDFDIAYLPGEDNIVADALSRLCPKENQLDTQIQETVTIATLLATCREDKVDEWQQQRIDADSDYMGRQYMVQDTPNFMTLHTQVATINALQGRMREFRYIPPNRQKLIKMCHNHEIGHWGVNTTLELLEDLLQKDSKLQHTAQQWSSSQRRKDVAQYIQTCDTCIKMREKKLLSHTNKYITNEYGVMKCISVDAIHMPRSTN